MIYFVIYYSVHITLALCYLQYIARLAHSNGFFPLNLPRLMDASSPSPLFPTSYPTFPPLFPSALTRNSATSGSCGPLSFPFPEPSTAYFSCFLSSCRFVFVTISHPAPCGWGVLHDEKLLHCSNLFFRNYCKNLCLHSKGAAAFSESMRLVD